MTEAEQLFWHVLRARRFGGHKFRRQHPVPPFVLDFYCEELKLGIELDGGHHNADNEVASDERRSAILLKHGVRIIRYWNHDVLNRTEEVLADLWNLVATQDSPSPGAPRHPLPAGEGKDVTHV